MQHVLAFLMLTFSLCESSNILIVSTVASHSHSIWCNKLAEILVLRGHEVTILDTDPPRKKLNNLTTITLENGYSYGDLDYEYLSQQDSPSFMIDTLLQYNTISCTNMINSQTFEKFLKEYAMKPKPFDLVIHDMTNCENFLGLVHYLGNPKLIGVSAFGEPTILLHWMRNHQNLIHQPLHLSPYSHPMSLIEKIVNLYFTLYTYWSYLGTREKSHINKMDASSKNIFGESTPHIWDIGRSTSLVLLNSHPILDGAKYYSPSIILIPGFHIDEPKELDTDTQEFLDGAVDGAIYFSLGSNILSANMTEDRKNMFLNIFKKLKQRVLWKFEDDSISELPSNVRMSKWYPQNDILAHPNIKLFITHSGLLSTHESIYHGVPMISMPFIIDQKFWAMKLAKKRVAVPLEYANLSEAEVQKAIDTVLTTESYRIEIKKMSKKYKDRPQHPKDTAVYWIEYVLRNDELEFLQPPEAYTSPIELFLLNINTISGFVIGWVATYFYFERNRGKKNRRLRFKKQFYNKKICSFIILMALAVFLWSYNIILI